MFLRTCQNREHIGMAIKIYLFMLCVIAAFSGSCKRYDENTITISADDLIDECKHNTPWFISKKYEQKIIRITGKILSVSYPKEGPLFFDKFSVAFGKLDDKEHLNNSEVYINCSFDNNDNIKYNLYEGKKITLEGDFDSYSGFLFKLKHCKLEAAPDDEAGPAFIMPN